mgnify:CR=1 FL=1
MALVDILFPAVPLVAPQQQLLRNFDGHVQIEHQVRPGNAQLLILKILHPGQVASHSARGSFPIWYTMLEVAYLSQRMSFPWR